jgi:hypothetical protein
MAITYPLDMPAALRVAEVQMRLAPMEAVSPVRGAYPTAVQLGTPFWRVSYRTPHLTRAQLLEVEAWLDSLRGSLGWFKATHPGRRYPLGHPAGWAGKTVSGSATAFDGTGTIDSVSTSLSRIRLNGLPAAGQFSPGLAAGDVISVALSGQGRQLFRVTTGGNATAGGTLSLSDLVPSVTARVVDGAAFTITAPWFEATVDPGSVQIVDGIDQRSVAFSASQVLR